MTRHGRALILLVCGIFCAILGSARSAHAKPFQINDEGWEGCSGLFELARGELGKDRVVAAYELNWSEIRPADAILFLHPERALGDSSLSNFLDAGGRFALLDDHGEGDRLLKTALSIERVLPHAQPATSLRHNPDLAVAEPALPLHPTVIDVERLVTNHPTGLAPAASYPQEQSRPTPVLQIHNVDAPDLTLALSMNAGKGGRGKLFIMGDPSALINEMLRYPGNRAFGIGLVRYLVAREGSGTEPKGRLFILVNDARERGSFAGTSGVTDDFFSRLDSMRDFMVRQFHDGLAGSLGHALAAALCFGLGAWVLSVASRTYRRRAPGFTRPVPLAAQGGAAGRAAVLAASSTPAALAMLELKSALEEGLAHELGVTGRVSTTRLIDEVRAKGALDDRSQWALKGILLEMANVETLVVAGQAGRVRRSDVTRAARIVFELLRTAKERLGTRTAA
jgi:hypothetical protein